MFLSRARLLSPTARTMSQSVRAASTAPSTTGGKVVDHLGSYDGKYEDFRLKKKAGDPNKRAFTYFVLGGARFLYATSVRLLAMKVVTSMSPSAGVLALASADFELAEIGMGQTMTVKWRGKPVFIRRRSDEEIAIENAVPLAALRDPETDGERVKNPEWIITLGICTHLGCVPVSNAGEYQGWFCPCHGSHYDISGRIRKGPAPLNLEVPPYNFLTDSSIRIG